MNDEKPNTANSQIVGRRGDNVTVLLPQHEMTQEEALRHAAWLIMCASYGDLTQFNEIFEAIKAT